MIRRFAAATALATGLALSMTGCLGDAGKKVDEAYKNLKLTAAQVLGKAAEKTGQTDSFKADMSMLMAGTSEGDVTMNGTMQYRTKPDLAYSMNFTDMAVGGKSIGGMEQRLVGRTMYMKMSMLSALGGNSAKPWFKISLDELGKQSGLNIEELLQQSRQMDPVQNTKMLTASKDVREVGKETVGGVETTHYTGTYRTADAIAKLSRRCRTLPQELHGVRHGEHALRPLGGRPAAAAPAQDEVGPDGRGHADHDDEVPRLRQAGADRRAVNEQVTDFSELMGKLGVNGGLPGA